MEENMTLEQLLEDETTTTKNLEAYFKTVGINNLDRKNLIKLLVNLELLFLKCTVFQKFIRLF